MYDLILNIKDLAYVFKSNDFISSVGVDFFSDVSAKITILFNQLYSTKPYHNLIVWQWHEQGTGKINGSNGHTF